jgi:AcrR family transcriptional regulator
MAVATCRDGLPAVTVSQILELARVGRRGFYEVFDNREDCFLAVFDHGIAFAAEHARPAFEAEHDWADRVRAGLLALLDFFDQEPELARICVVHALTAGPRTLAARARVIDTLTNVVDAGREARQSTGELSPLTAEGVLGAVFSVIHARMLRPGRERLSDLLNPLMAIVVLPYLGTRGAKRELARPVKRERRASAKLTNRSADPLAGIQIRMTYRTTCVLAAIASAPGASNRQVANAAGVKDQGQISKLLARLQGRGLVHNGGAGQPEGSTNAWTLTPKGATLARALSVSRSGTVGGG